MKKFMILLVAAFMFTGCGAKVENSDGATETTTIDANGYDLPEGKDAVKIKNPEKVFTEGDFTFYGENGVPVVSLGMEKSVAEDRMKNFGNIIGEFEINYDDHIVINKDKDATTETLVTYLNYIGYRNPVYTSKGIYTAGGYSKNEKCSPAEDVYKAYDINVDEESVIENKNDDNNYAIVLLFDKNDDRIVSPKDTDLSTVDYRRKIRFLINDGVVKSIDFSQNGWE